MPTLVIGAQHDTMDPAHMRMMAERLPRGRYLHCPDGSHMAMYDDQQVYFTGLIDFLHDLALCRREAIKRHGLLISSNISSIIAVLLLRPDM